MEVYAPEDSVVDAYPLDVQPQDLVQIDENDEEEEKIEPKKKENDLFDKFCAKFKSVVN